MLVVHGTKDGFLPYGQMVSVFNQQKGPKVLLSLLGANHGNWISPRSKWFPSVAAPALISFGATSMDPSRRGHASSTMLSRAWLPCTTPRGPVSH